MIRGLGIGVAAVAAGTLAGLARRARQDAQERGVGLGAALSSLPQTLRVDADGLKQDAKAAVDDGRAAGATREREVSESIEAALEGGR